MRLSGSQAEAVGTGWNAAAILWNGTQSLGWLVADNLLTDKPASKSTLDLLALYALSVGALLAQKQAHAALRESEAHLRESQQMLHTVLKRMPVRVFWKDRDFELSRRQPLVRAGRRAHGFRAAGRQKRFRPSLAQPSTRLSSRRSGGHGKWAPSSLQIEEQMTRADGSTIWVQTNKSPLRDSSGAIIGLIGAYIDITELKQAEASVGACSGRAETTGRPQVALHLRWRRTIFARR